MNTMFRRLTIAVPLFLVAASSLLSACAHSAATSPQPLTAKQTENNVQSFDLVWSTVRDAHFDPSLGGVDWNAAKAKHRPVVEKAKSMEEARAAMNALLEELGQSHFGIVPGEAYADAISAKSGESSEPKAAKNKPASSEKGASGLSFRVIGDSAIVSKVRAGSPALAAGIKTGWALHSSGGKPMSAGIQRLRESMPGSKELDFMLSRVAESRVNGTLGETLELTFETGDGTLVNKSVTLAAPAGKLVTAMNLPPTTVDFESRKLDDGRGGTVGYIWFSIFLDPVSLTPKINEAMRSFKDCRGVIFDVRGNPGGLGAMSMGIAGWFVKEPKTLGEMIMRGNTLKFIANPRGSTFDGPLAILVDGCSVSTSEIFAGGMKDIGRARLFGTRTAGAALPSVLDRLPNGDGFQYAIANYISAGGKPLEGDGVTPDEIVPLDRASLLQGRDNQIDSALKWIGSGKSAAAQ